VVDELGESLIQTIRNVRPQRLFLDGMEGFERAADFPERMSHIYSAIAQELERLGITALYSTETRELFARTIEVPITGLSAATQNIVVLRHIEHRATMLRVLAILKVRDDDYDAGMRELRITDDGIRLLDTFAGESGVASGGGVSSDPRAKESEA
jgi:circadian clock protein KaiC